ncbi:MAG: hypothetical protein ACLQFW_23580 [Xanthobacteraceae bacterium]
MKKFLALRQHHKQHHSTTDQHCLPRDSLEEVGFRQPSERRQENLLSRWEDVVAQRPANHPLHVVELRGPIR